MTRIRFVAAGVFLAVSLGVVPVDGDEPKAEPRYEGITLETWIHYLKINDEPKDRVRAVNAIGRLGSKDPKTAVPALVAALTDDESRIVRRAAAVALMDTGPPAKDAIPALLTTLKGDKVVPVREKVAMALGFIAPADKQVVAALESALLSDQEFLVRREAAQSLGKIGPGSTEGVSALRGALKDEYSAVRWQAIAALGARGHAAKDAAPDLLSVFKETKDDKVRQHASEALKKIDPEAAKKAGVP